MKRTLIAVVFLLLAACASLLPAPKTFSQRLMVGYGTVVAVRDSAATMVAAHELTAAEGNDVLEKTDQARAALDVARATAKTDLASADSRLTVTLTLLTSLRAYLASKGQ